jgi:hypothetical protein
MMEFIISSLESYWILFSAYWVNVVIGVAPLCCDAVYNNVIYRYKYISDLLKVCIVQPVNGSPLVYHMGDIVEHIDRFFCNIAYLRCVAPSDMF